MEETYRNLNADELRQYMARRSEHDYLLIDVRQPDEYAQGHIPGAILIPLGEVPARMNELPVEKDLVFYCRSGKRSQGAAIFVASRPYAASTVFNLAGGILGWEGQLLPHVPPVKIFALTLSARETLLQAMDLERGAERFYNAVRLRCGGFPWADALTPLAGAEEAHARLIYRFWAEGQKEPPDFETIYSGLAGDILEGGFSLAQLMDTLENQPIPLDRAVLEMALTVEYAAYDLYRNLAHQFRGEKMEEVCETVAEAEKEHMRFVAKVLT